MELERVAAHYSRSRGLAIAINVEPEVEQMMENRDEGIGRRVSGRQACRAED